MSKLPVPLCPPLKRVHSSPQYQRSGQIHRLQSRSQIHRPPLLGAAASPPPPATPAACRPPSSSHRTFRCIPSATRQRANLATMELGGTTSTPRPSLRNPGNATALPRRSRRGSTATPSLDRGSSALFSLPPPRIRNCNIWFDSSDPRNQVLGWC